MNEEIYDFKSPRKAFSTIGFAMLVVIAVSTLLQLALSLLFSNLGEGEFSSWGLWIATFVPIYCVGMPLGLLFMRRVPRCKIEEHRLSGKEMLILLPMCFCLMYAGNLVGTLLSMLLSGGSAQNALLDYAMDNNPLKILVIVILAPVLEEYICRKQIIDRVKQYGEKTAVFCSAMVFALFHMNLYQFFYAFALGWIFAYIYLRTGRLRYSIILHAVINFMGSVVAPLVLGMMDERLLEGSFDFAAVAELGEEVLAMLPGLVAYVLYSNLLMGLSIAGLVLIIVKRKKILWKESEAALPAGTAAKTAWLNPGMTVYVLLCLAFMVIALM